MKKIFSSGREKFLASGRKLFLIIFPLTAFAFAWPARALCPVCVVAVSAGLGLSEYLGIDDSIAGLWIGALLASLVAWTVGWFDKKGWTFKSRPWRDFFTALIYYAIVIWPLAARGFIGQPTNRLWGLDKLILGIIIGTSLFAAMGMWYVRLKKKNNGRAYFSYQKVVMPVGALIIFSFIFYFITR